MSKRSCCAAESIEDAFCEWRGERPGRPEQTPYETAEEAERKNVACATRRRTKN